MIDEQEVLRFTPSRTEGLSNVGEMVVRSDRLEVNAGGQWHTFLFSKIGRQQESAILSFLKRFVGKRPFPLIVGERDWCSPPTERYFTWYTTPPLKTYMPKDEGIGYAESYFPRIHETLARGNYGTIDLA